jgi:hypothetical protein
MSTKKVYMKLAHLVPDVVRMRAEGETLQSIGNHLGLSKQRIAQVIQAAKRQEGILHQWGWPFSVRTFNIIERLAIKSKEDAMDPPWSPALGSRATQRSASGSRSRCSTSLRSLRSTAAPTAASASDTHRQPVAAGTRG